MTTRVDRNLLQSPADKAGAFGGRLLHVREEQASGTNGQTGTSSDTKRVINTEKQNDIPGVSVDTANDTFTLPAGTYHYKFTAVARAGSDTSGMALYLQNDTDSSIVDQSVSYRQTNSDLHNNIMTVEGRVTLSQEKTFSVRHYDTSGSFNNSGASISLSGSVEVYLDGYVWKLD